MKVVLDAILLFEKFNKDIEGAIRELSDIKSELNRSHLQKLLYVDLVNRFDALIDSLLVEFSASEGLLKLSVLESLQETPITRSEVYEVLMAEDPREVVIERIKDQTKIAYLNKRHSEKLILLLKQCFGWLDKGLEAPRVDTDGRIFQTMRRKGVDYPLQVPGFADWLYSRRNVLVHSTKNKLFERDREYIERRFRTIVPSTIYIRLESIKTASAFYMDLCSRMKAVVTGPVKVQ